jgi:hypothetical protein
MIKFEGFEWDEANLNHATRHGISREEIEGYERLADLTLKHGVRVKLVLKEPTKQISIRVPVRDLEQAHKIARERKVNYQSVLKSALRRGLAAGA